MIHSETQTVNFTVLWAISQWLNGTIINAKASTFQWDKHFVRYTVHVCIPINLDFEPSIIMRCMNYAWCNQKQTDHSVTSLQAELSRAQRLWCNCCGPESSARRLLSHLLYDSHTVWLCNSKVHDNTVPWSTPIFTVKNCAQFLFNCALPVLSLF